IALCLLSINMMAQETLVKVEQDELIKKLMTLKKEVDSEAYASQFFTIQLYYGKYEVAERIITAFKENYPEWEADLSFETPNYKVQVGRFKQYYNALNKLNEIKKAYPGAFLLTLKN
ncbi:hypothetical protein N9P53_05565, partial [Flavobacteriaceae bacterium]|nr:hypothetical protein [Flavobacteriaceae bacterium]